MPVSRDAAWGIESNRGHSVWEFMCRTVLGGVDWAAQLFGFEATEGPVEREVDGAQHSEFDRGRLFES